MARDCNSLRFDRINIERSVYPPGLHMPPHTDKLSRISILLDGELKESTQYGAITATRNSVVIKPHHVVHENTFGATPLHILSISFNDPSLLAQYYQHWQWAHHPALSALGLQLWTQMRQVSNQKMLTQKFDQFFNALSHYTRPSSASPGPWVEQLRKILATNLHEPQPITALSEQLDLHRVSLARAFKKQYACSPVQYRQQLKLLQAIKDLATTSQKLAAIAYEAGFADQSHLTRAVKQLTGYTPAAFRQLFQQP